jgi:hypothetical protein
MDPSKAHVEKVDETSSNSEHIPTHQAIGEDIDNLSSSYWRSPKFIGSCIATILAGNNLYFGYAIPVNLLNVINADIGTPFPSRETLVTHPIQVHQVTSTWSLCSMYLSRGLPFSLSVRSAIQLEDDVSKTLCHGYSTET